MKKTLKTSKNNIMPSVCIVIVNYNGKPLLERHLPSVVATDYSNKHILVVDNGSTDSSIEFLENVYPEVEIIKNSENLGFSRGNNVAFQKRQDFDYYALLNNDMEVSKDWLTLLIENLEKDHSIAAVGPKVLYAKERNGKRIINSAGGLTDRYDRGFDRYEGCENSDLYNSIEEVDFVTGGAVVVRKKAVKEVDGFDDRMFFYYEDVDLCLRLREKGWKILYDGNSEVIHDHMGTARSWSSFKVTYNANINRIKSIQQRKGIMPAFLELVRAPIEWVLFSLYGKIVGTSYRQLIQQGIEQCRKPVLPVKD